MSDQLPSNGTGRSLSPEAVNIHQFYPQIDHSFNKDTAPATESEAKPKENDSNWGGGNKQLVAVEKGVDEDKPGKEAGGETSETAAEFNTSATAETDNNNLKEEDGGAQAEDDKELFSTEVTEETLEAAKQRAMEAEDGLPSRLQLPTLHDVIHGKVMDHYCEGIDHYDKGGFEHAINCFTKAINLEPNEVTYYVQRAEAYLLITDFQSSILNYKRACVLNPDNFQYYSRLAFIYYFQGQCLFDQKLFAEALESFSRAAEMRPEIVGYHTRSVACLAALDRHGECLALVNKRLESEHDNADLFVMRARLHQLFRNTTLCYYDIKDALALDPSHDVGLALMQKLEHQASELRQQAVHLNLVGRFRDALQKISIAIETNPSIADFHVLRGALHRKLSDFNSAIDDYLLALDKTDHEEENPVYIEAQRQLLLTYNDFAVECFTKGFYEEAIILLNKAIKGEKTEKGLYVNRGDCFFHQGQMAFALADYQQALELDPIDISIHTRISAIHNEYGLVAYEAKNYQEAESRFTLAIQHNPRMGHFYISRARTFYMMEDEVSARQDIIFALHLDPSNPETLSLMTRLFPGKSVKDVLQSRMAMHIQSAVQHLSVTASPIRLESLSPWDTRSEGSGSPKPGSSKRQTANDEPPLSTWAPGQSLPDLRACIQESKFLFRIAKEKKQIKDQVKDVLHNRQSLKYGGARLQPLPTSTDYARQSRSPLKRETLAAVAKTPTGWRTFGQGVSS